jgi:hypothetical protein
MRVKLTVDLTKYDSRCSIGAEGNTCPPQSGGSDLLTGVAFDSGARLDVFSSGLEIIDADYLRQRAAEEAEEVRTAREIILYLGPLGGFQCLSYQCSRGHISDGSKQSAERKVALFRERQIPVREVFRPRSNRKL